MMTGPLKFIRSGWPGCGLSLVMAALWLGAPAGSAQVLPDNLTLTNITIQGQPRTLQLYKRSVRAPAFTYLTWTSAGGYVAATPPPVRTYRGTVVGAANTIVCAVIKPGGLLQADGFDYERGKSYTWQLNNVNVSAQLPPGSFAPTELVLVAAETASVGAASGEEATGLDANASCGCTECGGELESPPTPAAGGDIMALGALPPSTYMPPAGGMQVMNLGVDITHYRYHQTYGGNADLAFANIEHTVNHYDLMMARDAKLAIQQSVVVLRQNIFYVPTSMGGHLNLILSAWKAAPLAALPWAQVHSFATEQGLFGAGGYAWQNQIGKNQSPANVEALYHEAGHNWDVVHLVYGADTMGGNRPNHGPFSMDRLLRKRSEAMGNGSLTAYPGTYPDPLPPYTHVDCASTLTNTPVDINVLANDWDSNGDPLTVVAFSTNTLKGATVLWVSNGVLRYTPPAGYVGKDIFAYTVQDSTGLRTRELVHVEVVNRELALHYAFDDLTGKNATDGSGHGHTGRLQGASDFATHSEPGVSGGALRVDGGVICDNSPLMPADVTLVNNENYWPFDAGTMARGNFFDPMDESCTIAFWFKTDDVTTPRSLLRKQWHDEQKVGFNLSSSSGGLTATVREFNGLSSVKTLTWSTPLAAGRWYHLALQFDRTANQARLFVDGAQRASAALDAGRFIFHGRQPLVLGPEAGGQIVFDEFRYYTKALSLAEIQALYAIGHIAASGPVPADGERNVALLPVLRWVAGRTNYQHDVYFGTDPAAVAAATTNSAEYAGRRSPASYAVPESLLPETWYYWRVDEIFGGMNVAPGAVWSFRTAVDALHGGLKLHLSGDARDTIGNVTYDRAGPPFHDGTLVNAPAAVVGQVAEAFAFNGTSQSIEVPALNLPTDSVTLLTWLRRSGNQVNYAGILFHRGTGGVSGMNISTGNRLGYHWNDAPNTYNFNAGPVLPDGQWALAAVVVETNRAILYLGTTNGVLTAATNNVSHGLTGFGSALRLAGDSGSTTRFFSGALDETGIWNRTLTRDEIGLILTNGMAGGGIDGPPPLPQPGTFTWTGEANSLWNNAGNWAANALPVSTNVVIFDESSAKNLDTQLGGNQSVAGALITGKLRALGIGAAPGQTLSLGADGLSLSNSFTSLTLAAPVSLLANQVWTVSELAALNASSNLNTGGRTLLMAAEGAVTLGGIVSGTGALIKDGGGVATLTRAGQTLTGGLVVSNGTLRAYGGEWASSFFANVSPRTITLHPGATLETTTHSLGGLGASFNQPVLTLNDGATWRLNAEQYLNGGNLILKGATVWIVANDLRSQGGTVAVNASPLPTTITGSGVVTLYGNTTFNVANGPLETDAFIRVPIAESGGARTFTKAGAGTLAFTEPVSYSGLTTISGGTLSLRGGKDTLPQTAAVSLSGGATLALNDGDQTLSSITGSGSVQLGYGTLTLALLGTQTFGGAISGSPDGAPPSSGNTEESPNPGGFTKAGTGRLTFTGLHTYSGDTLINSGVLALSGGGTLAGSSNLVVAGAGTLDVTARTGGSLPLAAGQTLKGNGTVLGAVSVDADATISPGESVGTLMTGPQTWSGGGIYRWEIDHATAPGSWDSLTITGALNIASSAGNQFHLRLVSPAGPLPGFHSASNYAWPITTTTAGVTGWATDKFTVDASGLNVDLAGGSFTVEPQGNALVLRFHPYVMPPALPPNFSGITLSNGFVSLTVTGAPGQVVVLESATNLTPPILWSAVWTNQSDPHGSASFVDPVVTNPPVRFYRTLTP